MKIDIMGSSGAFWKESGDFITTLPGQDEKYKVLYSGGTKSAER